ncbi:glycogen synthase [Streptomyces sp. SID6673]|nr:glycogen synthase [Streptomyces sp. SID11726]NDZ94877.1 glycogen synthase [Streptomyces sp. SID11726]NEB23037.1 glycogen synthase [Streptomyces sp. SID6673]
MPRQNRELQLRQSADIDAVARVIARAERNSFVGTELIRTAGLGLDSRQDVVGAVGIAMARRGQEVVSQMAAECVTDEERAIALDYARAFHVRSVEAYDEFAQRAYDQ